MEKLPYSRVDTEVNETVTAIIENFNNLAIMAEKLGFPIKLHTNSKGSLVLYYHDDHPNMILVDKSEIGY